MNTEVTNEEMFEFMNIHIDVLSCGTIGRCLLFYLYEMGDALLFIYHSSPQCDCLVCGYCA